MEHNPTPYLRNFFLYPSSEHDLFEMRRLRWQIFPTLSRLCQSPSSIISIDLGGHTWAFRSGLTFTPYAASTPWSAMYYQQLQF